MLKRKVNAMIENFNKNHHVAMLRGMFNIVSNVKNNNGDVIFRSYEYAENPDYGMYQTFYLNDDGSFMVSVEVCHNHPEYGMSTIWHERETVSMGNLSDVVRRMEVCAVGAIATYIF